MATTNINAVNLPDLVIGILRNLGPATFTQALQDLQHYEIISRWLKKDRMVVRSGRGVRRTIALDLTDVAREVGLHQKDELTVPNTNSELTVDWTHQNTHWTFDRREILMAAGRELVTDVIKPRRANAIVSLAQLIEAKAFDFPASGDNGTLGVNYWIVYNATDGFTGAAPSGYTTVGGINPSTKTNWKNYSFTFTTLDSGDGVPAMRKAHRNTNFVSPVDSEARKKTPYRILVGEQNFADLEAHLDNQNDNLGGDVAGKFGRDFSGFDGGLQFKRNPVVWVPQLDDAAFTGKSGNPTNPIYFINHDVFHMAVLKGDILREQTDVGVSGIHNSTVTHLDLTHQIFCVDRRRCAIGATAAVA